MTRRALAWSLVGVATAALLLLPSTSLAKKKKRRVYWQQYAVPFTCGDNVADNVRVEPGDYAVAIDIRNAGDADVTLNQTVSLTFPPGGLVAGPVSDTRQDVLLPGESFQVSCDEILGSAFTFQGGGNPQASPYVQGFLVIEGLGALDVNLTQTATGATGEVSVDSEMMSPRTVSQKVLLCHGNKTISVATAAWPAHQAHGDVLGPCD